MFPRSYAVLWREGEGPVSAGELVLGPTSLRLETGARRERLTSRILQYRELSAIEQAAPSDRIFGRPTAMIERHEHKPVSITALDGLGVAHEIVERLAALVHPGTDP
jgi:hypothetical protein